MCGAPPRESPMHMSFEKIETYTGPKHQAPQDCRSAKGVTCDICFAPMPVVAAPPDEPAAVRAARMIKELHLEQIAMMDAGFVFKKAGREISPDVYEAIDCNDEIRAACLEQIKRCDALMNAAVQEQPLPEIGNYDHEKS